MWALGASTEGQILCTKEIYHPGGMECRGQGDGIGGEAMLSLDGQTDSRCFCKVVFKKKKEKSVLG